MKKEMLINVLQPEECRIAIVENGVLEELYVERTSHESYTGNIYKGKVVNLEPAIQAAFVDFSVGRNGFLHVSDVEPQYYNRLEPQADEVEPSSRPGPHPDQERAIRAADAIGTIAAAQDPSRPTRRFLLRHLALHALTTETGNAIDRTGNGNARTYPCAAVAIGPKCPAALARDWELSQTTTSQRCPPRKSPLSRRWLPVRTNQPRALLKPSRRFGPKPFGKTGTLVRIGYGTRNTSENATTDGNTRMNSARLSPRNHAGDQEGRPSRLIPIFLLAALSEPDTRSRRPSPRRTNPTSEVVIARYQGRPKHKDTKSSARKPSGKDSQPTLSPVGNHVAGVGAAVHHLRRQRAPRRLHFLALSKKISNSPRSKAVSNARSTAVPRRVRPRR